MAEWYSCW